MRPYLKGFFHGAFACYADLLDLYVTQAFLRRGCGANPAEAQAQGPSEYLFY